MEDSNRHALHRIFNGVVAERRFVYNEETVQVKIASCKVEEQRRNDQVTFAYFHEENVQRVRMQRTSRVRVMDVLRSRVHFDVRR